MESDLAAKPQLHFAVRSAFRLGRALPKGRSVPQRWRGLCAQRASIVALLVFLSAFDLAGRWSAPSRGWVGAALAAQAALRLRHGRQRISQAAALQQSELKFDPNSVVDMTEQKLLGTTLHLTSSVFGFPDFNSLVHLNDDGSVRFYAGMVSKEPGSWSVVEGDQNEGERPDDLYLEFTQPLTDRYKNSFSVPGGTCFWRGKLDIQGKTANLKVAVEGGVVVSEEEGGKNLVREGVFRAVSVDEEAAAEVQMKNAEAFERALTTPKGETTGFKTPARIAGMGVRRPRKALPGARDKDDVDLEDD
uniref:Uncharacterized protein n=1 Tax=Pyrodinium bahamense TaxID=73915 RepID=A0A7S0FL98_9DINO